MNNLAATGGADYFVELNDSHTLMHTHAELKQIVLDAKALHSGRLWIGKDGGRRPCWQRFLGMKNYVDSLFAIEWSDADASLIFHDENWSEFRAIDREMPNPAGKQATSIAHGEQEEIAEDECLLKERAFDAIEEFIDTRTRPTWLTYRFAK